MKRPPVGVYPTRAWKHEALLSAVRVVVLERQALGWDAITAEEIAHMLRAKKGMVTACFQKLVHEGLVGHKYAVTHDGCWWPSLYRILPATGRRSRR